MPDCKRCFCILANCACPVPELPPEIYENPLKPRYRSPIDCLGYPYKCCGCIPLKAGVSIICFFSFMWALVELARSEKTIATIYPNKDNFFKCAELIHIFVITAYLASCGTLMLGIIFDKFKAINIYVWVAFMFNCICLGIVIISYATQVIRTEVVNKLRIATLLIIGVFWHFLFIYYISVVNSYKYRVYLLSI